MINFIDADSLLGVNDTDVDLQIATLINGRLRDLLICNGEDLSSLIHVLVIKPGEKLIDVDSELGFSLLDRPWDVAESHPGWFEITVVMSDDGFGWVIYVPKHATTDAALLEKCASYCKESMP